MSRHTFLLLSFCAVALIASPMRAQEKEDRTLLSWDAMRAIINEASGERAMHHVLELVPYPRVRDRAEYLNTFRETDVMVKFAKEYGFSDVEVESFPQQGQLWQPSRGELWMVEPQVRKLYDIYDVAISLAGNSESGDVTAEVVDLGVGARAEDYAAKDVKGKIVLGSTGPNTLQRLGVFERGAVGVVSYTSLRPDTYPDEILSSSLSANAPEGKAPGFGWVIAPRVARELSSILASGKKVVLRSIVKVEMFPGELETVHATIPGDGSTDQVVGISAHLYEGYIKQGANDDNSGCAMTLEMGRAYIRLIADGKLPKPKRTIHFIWVPEISGTNAWLAKHEDIKKKMIADLNFDMEGLRLATSGSSWMMHRTPDTFPSFLNDVGQSVLEFVGELNRERVRYRANGYGFSLPVVSPNGSQDPLYYIIDKHYGSSDHVTYMQNGIPSVIFITWPDMWYHSSQDVPDKLDPTQFKRAAVVGIGAMSVLASAGDAMAIKIAGECLSRGTERMGEAQRKGLSYVTDAPDAAGLPAAYREALNAIEHQTNVEHSVISSISVLFSDPMAGAKKLTPFGKAIQKRGGLLKDEAEVYYSLEAENRKAKASTPGMSSEEKDAAKTTVERIGGQGRGFGAMREAMSRLSEAEQASLRKVPQHMTSELNILMGQKKTVMEIRNFLSGEFEPLALKDLMEYLKVMEKMGTVKLTKS